jgi:hypothetical protein
MILKNKLHKIIRKKKKSIATIYSAILYLFISIAIIGIVTNFAIVFINDQQETYKYEVMLDEINKLDSIINNTANNKLNVNKINIKNPEYLEIDCNNNLIKGYINYNKEYKDKRTVVNGITTYKKLNKIYFEKPIDNDNRLNLNCRSLVLNKGENNLTIQYFNYDSEDEVINIDIFRSKSTRTNNWYNSNWLYRNKIDINKDLVDGNLEDFPILIESEDFNLLQYSKSDGSDIVFTLSDGRTKLYREIEDYNAQQLPYYIEEESEDHYKVWTKVDILANGTKTIYLKKEEGIVPSSSSDFNLFAEDTNTIKNISNLNNDLYKINITNITNTNLVDYNIQIPGESLNIDSNEERLKLYSGKLTAWVKIPKLLSNEDQFIYMYYGNDQGEEINSTKVWDEDYVLVQHLNDTNDSTKYSNNLTNYGCSISTDKYNNPGAYFFDGKTNYLYLEDNNSLDIKDSLTVSAWVKTSDINGGILVKGQAGGWANNEFGLRDSYDRIKFFTNNKYNYGEEGQIFESVRDGYFDDKWYYVTGVSSKETNKHTLYINGEISQQIDRTIDELGYEKNDDIYIGKGHSTSYWYGKISEVRLSKEGKSYEWIKTEYNNQNDVSKFININNMERI